MGGTSVELRQKFYEKMEANVIASHLRGCDFFAAYT